MTNEQEQIVKSLTGYLLINKPKNYTSYDCIRHLKRIITQELSIKAKKLRIGHTGTLDPFATGLLIICIGRQATKTISQLMDLCKSYTVTAKLGELTDTLDLTGKLIDLPKPNSLPSREDLLASIKALGDGYVQIPPIYSALKHQGKPLYKIARGQSETPDQEKLKVIVEGKKRFVQLHNIELTNYAPPFFSFHATVSKGTYIRSLANDIASPLNATTYELERTAIGPFFLSNATPLEKIETIEDIKKALLKLSSIAILNAPSK